MKTLSALLFVAVLALAQAPGKADQKEKKSPRLGFTEANGAVAFVDTDIFDQEKYTEAADGDTAALKAKRAAHEEALMREFMDGFNQTKECDGIILMGKGDNEPDFGLQVMIDSHDTPGQKTVWNWVLKDMHKNRVLPVGFNLASGKDAAQGICHSVWANTDPERVKKPTS